KGADRCRGDILHAGQSDLGQDGSAEAPVLVPDRTGKADDRNPTGIFRYLHILDMDHAMIAHGPEQGGVAHIPPDTGRTRRGNDPTGRIEHSPPTIDSAGPL